MPSVIGFDLGGTKSAVARFDAKTLEVQALEHWPTHAQRGWPHVLEDIVKLIDEMRAEDTQALGIGVPGLVRQPEGTAINMPNIPEAKDVPLKHILEERLKMPVAVENDANCFALAEARQGVARGHSVVVGITMGTGVGGGIVIDGKIFQGSHGYAAEIGHMLAAPTVPPFGATNDGRGIGQFVSGAALGRRCPEGKNPEGYFSGAACASLRPLVFREIAWMCVSLTHLLDPSVIVFGGAAGRALQQHLAMIEEELKQWTLPGTPLPTLAIAELKDAAVIGAALLTRG